MKYALIITFVLLAIGQGFPQTPTAAYKLLEYEHPGIGCDPFFRLVYFLEELQKQPGSKGMIVIYTGGNKLRLGNVTGYVKGAKAYIDDLLAVSDNLSGLSKDDITVQVGEGRSFFAQEFWIIPREAAMPDVKSASLNWGEFTDKYYFSTTCFQCDPSYPQLTGSQANFEDYADILRKYPNYSGLITVYDMTDAVQVKKMLTGKYGLARNRYKIRIQKKDPDPEKYSIAVDLFILPGRSTISKN